ncbi:hypothetical protein [Aurantibacter sp.]|uniref:hypothetical protein n=1 Tax=Aurantibacter sp. TaxID=2807103 RepID=UPI0035C7961A
MKYVLWLVFLAAAISIILGFTLTVDYTEKLIGFGTCGLFLVWIPLFIYHNWKGKNPRDYMLTHKNLEAMKNSQKRTK